MAKTSGRKEIPMTALLAQLLPFIEKAFAESPKGKRRNAGRVAVAGLIGFVAWQVRDLESMRCHCGRASMTHVATNAPVVSEHLYHVGL